MTADPGGVDGLGICLVGPAWPHRGGISHYNTCLALEASRRHDVRVIGYSRLYPKMFFPGRTQFDESESSHMVDSERLIDSVNPLTWVRAGWSIARGRPDLTVVQWWHPYFAPAVTKICSMVRLFSSSRIVFICHNVVPHEGSPAARLMSAAAFRTAHGFIVQSSDDREHLLEIRRNAEVIVRPHPIYDFFRTGDTTREEARRAIGAGEGPLILFFGYIRPYKGLRYLLEAMPAITRRTGARLLVVGEFYEDSAPYLDLVEELGIAGVVDFVDRYVGNEEVERYFTAADLVALPYVTATQSGIAQIALAFDRPMVATDVGGLPEVVAEEKTGFLVPPEDPGALASAAVRFFEEGWARRMERHFDSEKRRFSWEVMVGALEEMYASTGGRARG